MTPARFRHCLDLLWLSSQKLAAILGEDERLVRRWKSGAAEIPPDIASWLERLAAAHEANPVPGARVALRAADGVDVRNAADPWAPSPLGRLVSIDPVTGEQLNEAQIRAKLPRHG